MSETKYEPVVFLNSNGETISNDPVYLAQQTLQNAGVAFTANGYTARQGASDDEVLDDGTYKSYNKDELLALAKDRGVETKGIKTVGDLRARLIEADEVQAAEAADSEGETNTGNDEE